MAVQRLLLEKIRGGDRAGAGTLLDEWASNFGYEHPMAEVIDPMLMLIGEEWSSSGSFTLAETYVAAKVAEDVMHKIAASKALPYGNASPKGPVVIGNVEEDFPKHGAHSRQARGTPYRPARDRPGAQPVRRTTHPLPCRTVLQRSRRLRARAVGGSRDVPAGRALCAAGLCLDRRGLRQRAHLPRHGASEPPTPGRPFGRGMGWIGAARPRLPPAPAVFPGRDPADGARAGGAGPHRHHDPHSSGHSRAGHGPGSLAGHRALRPSCRATSHSIREAPARRVISSSAT